MIYANFSGTFYDFTWELLTILLGNFWKIHSETFGHIRKFICIIQKKRDLIGGLFVA